MIEISKRKDFFIFRDVLTSMETFSISKFDKLSSLPPVSDQEEL